MTDEDLKAEIEQLRAENERLKKPHERGLSMKVSPKVRSPCMGWADSPSRSTRSNGHGCSTPPTIYARFSRRTTPNSSPREHPTDPETPLKLNGHTAHKTRIVMLEDTVTDLADSAAE